MRWVSWPTLAATSFWFATQRLHDWRPALAATLFLICLSGIAGPKVANPISVDLPATTLALLGAAAITDGNAWLLALGLVAVLLAACAKETTPIFAAVWAWSPLPLVALAAPAARLIWVRVRRLEIDDPLGESFAEIARHPLRAGVLAHANVWRNPVTMLAPWGACLAALYQPSWPVLVALVVAHAQLLVATDTVRLVHHAAAPVLAVAAARNIPMTWLALAVVGHFFLSRRTERV